MDLDVSKLTVVGSCGSYFPAIGAYLLQVGLLPESTLQVDFDNGTDDERYTIAAEHGMSLCDLIAGESAPFVSRHVLYRIEGWCYDDDAAEYEYIIPAATGNFWMVDCWVVDKSGEKHHNLNVPVPFTTLNFEPVGESPWATAD